MQNEAKEPETNDAVSGRVDLLVSLPLPVVQRLVEHCWSATSKLESQVMRNPSLPVGYADAVKESFKALDELQDAIIAS